MKNCPSSRRTGPFVLAAACGGLALLAPGAEAQIYDVHYDGTQTGGNLGGAVSTGFDCDGDGIDDVAVGAPDESGMHSHEGVVRIWSGATHALLNTFLGTASDAHAGAAVALVGDMDGDGLGDVVIGSPGYSGGQGLVAAYSVATGALLWNVVGAAGEQLGFSLAAAGDVDHDGHFDVIAGAPGGKNVYLYGWGTGALHVWNSAQTGAMFGFAVSGNVDVDGDGTMDVIISDPLYDTTYPLLIKDCGRVSVYSGKTYGLIFARSGDNAGDELGTTVCGLGDVNGDGKAEVLAGTPYYSQLASDGGLVREYDSSGTKLADLVSPTAGDEFGASLARLPDVDGDGAAEYAIGAIAVLGYTTPRVELHHGGDDALLWTYLAPDPTTDHQYGNAIAGGDVNGDGTGDVVIGDALADVGGVSGAGRADVWVNVNATATGYGVGFPGTHGVPSLLPLAEPGIGTTFTADVGNSLGATTTGLLVLGFSRANLVTSAGGTLLVTPFEFVPLQIPAGGLLLSGAIPDDTALLGTNVDLQVLEADPGAQRKLSFTPGLELLIGVDYQ